MAVASAPALLAMLLGCAKSPVEWSNITIGTGSAGADSFVALDVGVPARLSSASGQQPPASPGLCRSSLRVADAPYGAIYAVWWRARRDSSVVLEATHSLDNGRTWREPVPVDTVDRTRTGCDRPAPAIAVERDNVHIVYSLHGPEGTGVFFAHSMDRAGMFHAPVSIVYGDHLTEASVAASGDRVVIAYVDPNTTPPQIGLAISNTQGHNFQPRVLASEGGNNSAPWIRLTDDRMLVAWLQHASSRTVTPTHVTRMGRLR
jgi:hypothetical protein